MIERELLHQIGAVLTLVYDALEDEGDRIYLGSTNHKQLLMKVHERYFMWRYLNNDPGPEDVIEQLEKAP